MPKANKPEGTTMAFRDRAWRRGQLEEIQRKRGHAQLSDTLREAISEYVERHLGGEVKAA